MYTCKCGREFTNKQSYVAHCGHCIINLGRDPKDRFGDSRAWARGKTKETSKALASMSNKLKGRKPFLGHSHSDETKKVMAEKARYNASNHINGWKAGDNRIPNSYEKLSEDILRSRNVSYEREVVVPKLDLGATSGSYYRLDFLINGIIDLEIDGSSHNKEHDSTRDYYVSKKYKVFRISHNNSISELESKLNEFIDMLDKGVQL